MKLANTEAGKICKANWLETLVVEALWTGVRELPPTQLENALNKTAALKAPLVAHASQPNIRSTLPRAVLTVLGITLDAQNTSQVQSSQTNMVDSSNSEKEVAVPEKSKESSVAG